MSERAKSCYLKSSTESLLTVHLPDSVPIFIGRSEQTNITDLKCSRQQVRLCADYTQYTVSVQQIGTRACGINGFKTQKDIRSIAKHNDHLEILYGKHVYQIEFNPPPKKQHEQIFTRKRSYESHDESLSNDRNSYKMPKTEDACDVNTKKMNNKNGLHFDDIQNDEELNATASTSKENKNDRETKSIDSWETNKELLIYNSSNEQNTTKIAAYDMDGTLIKTKSGLIFPKTHNDWQLLYPEVPNKLKQLYNDGYKIVIFTNQAGLGTGKIKIEDFKTKIEKVVKRLNVPIQVFVSTGKGIYRKPAPGMWNMLVTHQKNKGLDIDKSNSFYVGDAAGRQKNWAPGKKKDHSSVDRLMAINIGLQFQTPEEHFLGHKAAPYILPTFNPKALPQNGDICLPTDAKIISDQQEVILMVGSPGSGKSHFAKFYLANYEYINRDTLGSWQKCVSAMEQSLTQRKHVVIDNTNPDRPSRERYIVTAKKYNVPIRCFLMTTTIDHAKHNNKFRELIDSNHSKISDIIINSYMKTYTEPTLDEGFTEILKINFIPRFLSETDRELYEMYLLEN